MTREKSEDEKIRKACLLEGCGEDMYCFGGDIKGLCIEAIAQYNELKRKELLEKMSNLTQI